MLTASNPRKRRRKHSRRGKNPMRAHRRRRGSRRRHGRNPSLSLSHPTSAITAGFKPSVLMDAGVLVGGALGNSFVSGAASRYLPSMFQMGVGNYALGLATAGLLSAGVNMIAPRYASRVFQGAVLEVVMRAANQYIIPTAVSTVKGLEDYLTQPQAAGARPLGDYLTQPQAANARSLGYMGDPSDAVDGSVGDVLAADGSMGSLF